VSATAACLRASLSPWGAALAAEGASPRAEHGASLPSPDRVWRRGRIRPQQRAPRVLELCQWAFWEQHAGARCQAAMRSIGSQGSCRWRL